MVTYTGVRANYWRHRYIARNAHALSLFITTVYYFSFQHSLD